MLLKQLMAKVVDLHPNATTIEDLNAFPFFKMYIPNLKRIKKELPTYLAMADCVSNVNLQGWWSKSDQDCHIG